MRFFLLLVFIAPFLFGLDMQILKDKAEKKDKDFFLQLLLKTEVYEDMQKIPNNLKNGECYITENYYGSREFYIIDDKGDSKEFNHPFFLKILSDEGGGSSFSNMFSATGIKEYDTASTNNTFKPYVSNTDSVRIGFLEVPDRADHMEKALNDYLLNNNIYPQSIVNIEIKSEKEIKTLWIFYRP